MLSYPHHSRAFLLRAVGVRTLTLQDESACLRQTLSPYVPFFKVFLDNGHHSQLFHAFLMFPFWLFVVAPTCPVHRFLDSDRAQPWSRNGRHCAAEFADRRPSQADDHSVLPPARARKTTSLCSQMLPQTAMA